MHPHPLSGAAEVTGVMAALLQYLMKLMVCGFAMDSDNCFFFLDISAYLHSLNLVYADVLTVGLGHLILGALSDEGDVCRFYI